MERLGDSDQFKKRNMELEGFDRITAGGFTQMPNVIQNDPTLNLGEKAVYAQFLQYAWHHDYCFPSQHLIAKNLGLTRSRITQFVKGLEKRGYLTIQRRGLGKTNWYVLHATIKRKQ